MIFLSKIKTRIFMIVLLVLVSPSTSGKLTFEQFFSFLAKSKVKTKTTTEIKLNAKDRFFLEKTRVDKNKIQLILYYRVEKKAFLISKLTPSTRNDSQFVDVGLPYEYFRILFDKSKEKYVQIKDMMAGIPFGLTENLDDIVELFNSGVDWNDQMLHHFREYIKESPIRLFQSNEYNQIKEAYNHFLVNSICITDVQDFRTFFSRYRVNNKPKYTVHSYVNNQLDMLFTLFQKDFFPDIDQVITLENIKEDTTKSDYETLSDSQFQILLKLKDLYTSVHQIKDEAFALYEANDADAYKMLPHHDLNGLYLKYIYPMFSSNFTFFIKMFILYINELPTNKMKKKEIENLQVIERMISIVYNPANQYPFLFHQFFQELIQRFFIKKMNNWSDSGLKKTHFSLSMKQMIEKLKVVVVLFLKENKLESQKYFDMVLFFFDKINIFLTGVSPGIIEVLEGYTSKVYFFLHKFVDTPGVKDRILFKKSESILATLVKLSSLLGYPLGLSKNFITQPMQFFYLENDNHTEAQMYLI